MSAALLLGRPEITKRSQMRKLQRKKKEREIAPVAEETRRFLLRCLPIAELRAPRERESGGDNPFRCRRLCQEVLATAQLAGSGLHVVVGKHCSS